MANKLFKNDTALTFNFSTGSDLTNNTVTTLYVRYPVASETTWTLTVISASEGSLRFTAFTTTSLKSAGDYLVYPKVTFSDDTAIRGETYKFHVYDSFE